MIIVFALIMTYHQIADLWIREGGSPYLASTMAAIARAESGGRMALANYDKHELGGSFCGYQIQRAHTEGYAVGEPGWNRERLLRDPAYCTRAAIFVERTFGLDAWTTHRRGTYLTYMERDPPAKPTPLPRVTPEQFLAYVSAHHRAPPTNWEPNAFHIHHPKRYTQFIPTSSSEKPSPAETVILGFVAISLVIYTRRAIRAAYEADNALKKRTRRRAPGYAPLRHRGVTA